MFRSPLIFVAVSRGGLSSGQLTVQLTYIYNQILSVLTAAQLNRIFNQRKNFDLRRMLSGSERLMTHLSNSMDTDPSFFLSAVRCLPLAAPVRDTVSESIIRFAGKVQDVVFGILIADNQLVTLVRMKKYYIHPADLHLVFNLINSSENFKHSESWTPICLPKFDSGGFLHAHVSYLTDSSPGNSQEDNSVLPWSNALNSLLFSQSTVSSMSFSICHWLSTANCLSTNIWFR